LHDTTGNEEQNVDENRRACYSCVAMLSRTESTQSQKRLISSRESLASGCMVRYFGRGMKPSCMFSHIMSSFPTARNDRYWAKSERFKCYRASFTSSATSHDTGTTLLYHGQLVA